MAKNQDTKLLIPESRNSEHWNCLYMNKRQWSILFTIMFLKFFGVLCLCSALSAMHTQQIKELLDRDILAEKDRHSHGMSSNEAKLQHSQHFVVATIHMVDVYLYISITNLLLTAILCYGVVTKEPSFFLPWIFFSFLSYAFICLTQIMAYLNLIPGLFCAFTIVGMFFIISPLLWIMWYVIVSYYMSIRQQHALMIPPTIVKTHGGLMHTIHNESKLI